MKQLIFTLILGTLLNCSINAQTAQETVTSAQEGLTTCSKQLINLVTSIEEIKNNGKAEFVTEQTAIDKRKAALEIRKAKYATGDDKEGIMALEAWPARVAEKKVILEEQQAVNMMQLKLNARKDDFEIRVKQLERAIAIFSEDILARANNFGKEIDNMNGRIDVEDNY